MFIYLLIFIYSFFLNTAEVYGNAITWHPKRQTLPKGQGRTETPLFI